MKNILENNCSEIALIIGNGINLYGSAKATNSWQDLLKKLAKKNISGTKKIPEGISHTEYYDLLDLQINKTKVSPSLQKQFCDLMLSWKFYDHHKWIVEWAKKNNCPILTTNFENTLSDAGECSLKRTIDGEFTDYYPWESYYGIGDVTDPSNEFGIWHINGMQHYQRSVRLGLSHYMGSVERARAWIHKGKDRRLFSGNNPKKWLGSKTWLHTIFNTPLLIFGLGLEQNEVFLRWLLIERARYFKKFPSRKKNAWYVCTEADRSEGKHFFLDAVGIECIYVKNYDDMYGENTWVR